MLSKSVDDLLQHYEPFGVLPDYGIGRDIERIDTDVVLDSKVPEVTGCKCVQFRFGYDIAPAGSYPSKPTGGWQHYWKDSFEDIVWRTWDSRGGLREDCICYVIMIMYFLS